MDTRRADVCFWVLKVTALLHTVVVCEGLENNPLNTCCLCDAGGVGAG